MGAGKEPVKWPFELVCGRYSLAMDTKEMDLKKMSVEEVLRGTARRYSASSHNACGCEDRRLEQCKESG